MADQILLQDKNSTTSRTGKFLWLQFSGAATPSGYDDEWIDPDDFLSPEQSRLDDLEAAELDFESRIQDLENGTTLRLDSNRNTSYTFTQDAQSELEKLYMLNVSGSPIVRIGTTLGGDEILSDVGVVSTYKADLNFSDTYASASRTIYVTISGGTVTIKSIFVKSIFTAI